MSDYVCLRSVNSGKIIRTYRSSLFGSDSKNPDAAINNQLMYQRLKNVIKTIAQINDVEQMVQLFDGEDYYVRGIVGNPKRSGYLFLYKNRTLICELGFCDRGLVAQRVWSDLSGQGFAPTPPFLAIKNAVDINFVPKWTVYYCKLLSWAWLDYFDDEEKFQANVQEKELS